MSDQKTIGGPEDYMTGLLAAIFKNGGHLDVSFEELGEAAITYKLGGVSIAVQRTATGIRYVTVPSGAAT